MGTRKLDTPGKKKLVTPKPNPTLYEDPLFGSKIVKPKEIKVVTIKEPEPVEAPKEEVKVNPVQEAPASHDQYKSMIAKLEI